MRRTGWLVMVVFFGLLASGCATRYVPPVPTQGASQKYTVKSKPYTVLGRTYYPMSDATGYDEVGVASWYGHDFHGKPTATGETYDMYGLSAAHKTLPLGTVVRVTHLGTHRSVELVVNDRGPFVGDRIIDLSYGAAKRLGVVDDGVCTVRVTAVGSRRADAGAVASAAPASGNIFHVRVGAFVDRANAQRVLQQLREAGYAGARIQQVDRNGTLFHVVQAGSFASRTEAGQLLDKVKRFFPTSYISM